VVCRLLEDEYPDVYRFTASVFPSEDDDVITSPYNAMLSLAELTEHADCVLPIENSSLSDICGRIADKFAKQPSKEGSSLSGVDTGEGCAHCPSPPPGFSSPAFPHSTCARASRCARLLRAGSASALQLPRVSPQHRE